MYTEANRKSAEAARPAGAETPTETAAPPETPASLAAAEPAVPAAPAVDAKGRPLAVVPATVPWLEVAIFVVIAFALAWLVCLPLWISGKGLSDPLAVQVYGAVMMFSPLVAGIVALTVQRKRAKRARRPMASVPRYLGIGPLRPIGRVIWMTVAAFFGTFVLVVLGYLVASALGWLTLDLTGLSGFRTQLASIPGAESLPIIAALAIYLALMLFGSLFNVIVTFGEESGWRGWLLTSLRPLGTWPALLIVGVIWGLWHAPLILLGYNFNRPDITGLGFMVGGCVMVGILFGWLRLRTGSVWPAVFAHAALNGSAGMLLALVMGTSGPTPDPALITLLGVSGWITSAIVIAVLIATGQFRRQPELGIKIKPAPAGAEVPVEPATAVPGAPTTPEMAPRD